MDTTTVTAPGNVSPWGAIAGEVGGSLVSSAVGLWQQKNQQDFQERMSNTAHQREVKDMIKAGLNPILSATGGSGASQPTGSMMTPDNPAKGIAADLLNYKMAGSQKALMAQQAASAKSQYEVNMANADLATKQKEKVDEEIKNIAASTLTEIQRAGYTSAQKQAQRFLNQKLMPQTGLYKGGRGNILSWFDYATDKIGDILPALNLIK